MAKDHRICSQKVTMKVVRESTGEVVEIEHVFTDFTARVVLLRIPMYRSEFRFIPAGRSAAYLARREEMTENVPLGSQFVSHVSESVFGKNGWGLMPFAAHILRTGRVELPLKTPAIRAIEARWTHQKA